MSNSRPDEPNDARPPRRRARIPAGRLERLTRIGWMAGELALGGVAEGARRLAGADSSVSNVFLTEANAKRLASRLSSLRGAAMKLGQLLSLEGDDFLPPEFAAALSTLRADASAMPEAQLRRVLAGSWGKGWRERFRNFDEEPIAAASIGQVHYAEAADGRKLALKIQYPGVARSIESDVDNLATAFRLARIVPGDFDVDGVVEEAKRQLRQEVDYLAEAAHLRHYAELLGDAAEWVVPRVHHDLTTRTILAMDHLPGLPLEDLCGPEHPAERRNRAAERLYDLLFRELFEFRFVQTDPNFANYLWLPEAGCIGLLDLGAARAFPTPLVEGYRRLFRAGIDSDRRAMRDVAADIGFFPRAERADRIDAVVDLMLLGTEAFRARSAYDFSGSDLAARIRAVGLDLAFGKGFFRSPPPETLFLHRKLAGTFLLCARLGARVQLRDRIEPWLDAPLAA